MATLGRWKPPSRYDPSRRRKASRSGAEKGVRVYLPAEELERAGLPLEVELEYRVWADPERRGGFVLRLYLPAP